MKNFTELEKLMIFVAMLGMFSAIAAMVVEHPHNNPATDEVATVYVGVH